MNFILINEFIPTKLVFNLKLLQRPILLINDSFYSFQHVEFAEYFHSHALISIESSNLYDISKQSNLFVYIIVYNTINK